MSNYRAYVANLLGGIRWARAYYGERVTVGFIGLMSDMIAEGVSQTVKARFEDAPTFPADALAYVGGNKSIERYPGDTDATYKARTKQAFSSWEEAGTRHALLRELSAFGYPGALLYEDWEWSRPPQPWWSQFWVLFPDGTHSVAPSTVQYGSGELYGPSGLMYGVTGITAAELSGLRRIIKKWKRASSICRGLIFVTGGIVYGQGITYGSGAVYGGTQVIVSGV